MNTSAPHGEKAHAVPSRLAGDQAVPHPGRPSRALRRVAMLAAVAFVAALATGCAGHPLSENVAATSRPTAAAQQQAAATDTPAAAPAATPTSPAATPTSPAATPTSPAQPSTAAPGNTKPHFDTPQAAMTYLAHAYNTWDVTALHYVTEPRAFARLMEMRSDAFNLRLKYCTANPRGDFTCYFRHDFPVSEHKTGYGQAVFIAAPALTPGWYMYQFQTCD